MCTTIASVPYTSLLPIVFIDESTIVENLNNGGVWHERGHYPPQTFYTKEQKPKSIMIWGYIRPHGYRTKLIRFDKHVTKETYVSTLKDNMIFDNINARFLDKWIWQQDGG